LLAKLGAETLPATTPALVTGFALLDRLGLPLTHLVILAMSAAAAAKQIDWKVNLGQEEVSPGIAVGIAAFNTVLNSANSLLFLWATTSVVNTGDRVPGTDLPLVTVVGAVLFVLGLALEWGSEHQRKAFKNRPENAGKVMKGGLWTLARHINYGGYAIWRGGYALASWSWFGGLVIGLWMVVSFLTASVPSLDAYCSKRYGQQWVQFKEEVPWVLLPGIY
jgi:protein-S-isoprenylcysteine O-methyltransferase Ste14